MKGGMELNSQKSFLPRRLREPNYSLQTETADVAHKRFHILSDETSDDSPLLGPVSLRPHQAPHDVEKVLTQLVFRFKTSLKCQIDFYRNATEHGTIPGACW